MISGVQLTTLNVVCLCMVFFAPILGRTSCIRSSTSFFTVTQIPLFGSPSHERAPESRSLAMSTNQASFHLHGNSRSSLDVRPNQPPDVRFHGFLARVNLPSCQFRFQGRNILPSHLATSTSIQSTFLPKGPLEGIPGCCQMLSAKTLFSFPPGSRFHWRRKESSPGRC